MASKSKKRRKVLGASCILAALIIAGSSFAWFTSSDEVTNRLTATANYGVSIVEDFTPPKTMVPGQEVDKDVAVVNTGSVDALARVHFTNVLNVSRISYLNLIRDSSVAETAVANVTSVTTAATEEVYYLDLTDSTIKHKSKADWDTYYAANSGIATKLYSTYNYGGAGLNSVAITALTEQDKLSKSEHYDTDGVTLRANEVTTLQAGGRLVVKASEAVVPIEERAGDDGEFVYVQVTDNSNRPVYQCTIDDSGSDVTKYCVNIGGEYFEVTKTTTSGKDAYTYTTPQVKLTPKLGTDVTPVASQIAYKDFDGSAQFLPSETGIYLFERTSYDDPNLTGIQATEYSGYYYVAGATPGAGDYYAFKTKTEATGTPATSYKTTPYVTAAITKDAQGIVSKIENLELKFTTAKQDYTGYFTGATNTEGYYAAGTESPEVEFTFQKLNSAGTDYEEATDKQTATRIKVDYTFGTTDGGVDDVVFYINLADGWATNWTYVAEDSTSPVAISDKTNALGYFYYNSPIDSGKTSEKLITSVTLDGATTPFAYKELTYDLNVILDSVQVTYLADNTESADVAKETWHTNLKDVNLQSTYGADGKSIDAIAWSTYADPNLPGANPNP